MPAILLVLGTPFTANDIHVPGYQSMNMASYRVNRFVRVLIRTVAWAYVWSMTGAYLSCCFLGSVPCPL